MPETARHPATQHLLDLFAYDHLPTYLQRVSKPFSDLAYQAADTLGDGPEMSAGLRKLLVAKDSLVRQAALGRKAAQ